MLEGRRNNRLVENHSSISSLVAFKPRQVLLAEQKQQQKKHQPRLTMTKKQLKEQLNQKSHVLEDDQSLALLHSVVKYISNKGFSKTLKKFLKEAQLEDDAWKENSFDLEEMYCKYLENSRNGSTNINSLKEQEESTKGTVLKDVDGDKDAPLDSINKKKKKKNDENGDNAKSSVSEVKTDNSFEKLKDKKKKKKNVVGDEDAPVKDDGKKTEKINEEKDTNSKSSVSEVKKDDSIMELKHKKKKKSKLMSESRDENGTEENSLTAVTEKKVVVKSEDAAEISPNHNKTEPKEKKKKKVSVSEKSSDNGVEVFDKEQSQETLDNGTDKNSKKRKRSASDESKDTQVKGVAAEESKKRKTEEAEVIAQQAEVKTVHGGDVHLSGETKEENGNVSQFESPKPSSKQFDDGEKGNLMNNIVGKSSGKKSAMKQRDGSAQPKMALNAFQRVKVDAVEFADERLQDNSYWAKDGAEIGYGAKAQEILGQVKGRDFRHEKTKKKRGSYRGGQIDLQSHSVKFNYSDDE